MEKENEKWGQTMHAATMSRMHGKTKAIPLERSQMHGIRIAGATYHSTERVSTATENNLATEASHLS